MGVALQLKKLESCVVSSFVEIGSLFWRGNTKSIKLRYLVQPQCKHTECNRYAILVLFIGGSVMGGSVPLFQVAIFCAIIIF